MSDALSYRRVVVVDAQLVAENARAIARDVAGRRLVVSAARRSNRRFLAEAANGLNGYSVSDAVDPEAFEVSMHDLLGGHPLAHTAVALESHVFGIRDVAPGEGVSYGATYVATRPSRIALAPIGFADGLDRKLSGALRVRVNGVEVPVVGRIAMDSISIDVTDVVDVELGSVVSVFGDTRDGGFSIDDAARTLGITTGEIITRLSERATVEWR